MTEAEQIDRYIAEHGVTRCRPGFAEVTQAADPFAPLPVIERARKWTDMPKDRGMRRASGWRTNYCRSAY